MRRQDGRGGRRMNGSKTGRQMLKAVLALLCCALVLGGCSHFERKEKSKGQLRVGVRSDVMDFAYRNQKTGRFYGLEIDLARELARRLGYDGVTYVTVTQQNREDVLLSGEADCIIACFTVTGERRKRLDFSEPYYTDSLWLLVEDSSMIRTVRGLRGCTIGVLKTSNAQALATKVLDGTGLFTGEYAVRFASMDTYDEMSFALETGVVDAMLLDGSIAWGYYDDDRSKVDISIGEQPYAVATLKGSPLSGPIDEAVRELIAEGYTEALAEKWL